MLSGTMRGVAPVRPNMRRVEKSANFIVIQVCSRLWAERGFADEQEMAFLRAGPGRKETTSGLDLNTFRVYSLHSREVRSASLSIVSMD